MDINLSELEQFYKKYSEKYGDESKSPESFINWIGYSFLAMNKIPEAIFMFKYNIQLYPESVTAFGTLAEAYLKIGNKELAIENYENALKLDPTFKTGIDALNKLRINNDSER